MNSHRWTSATRYPAWSPTLVNSKRKPTWPDFEPDFATTGLWRNGDDLVMKRDAVLPPFCFKTGVPTNSTVTRKFVWKSRLENYHGRKSLLMMIVTRIFAQRAVVEIPLCKKQQTKRYCIVLFGGFSALLAAFLGLRNLFFFFCQIRSYEFFSRPGQY